MVSSEFMSSIHHHHRSGIPNKRHSPFIVIVAASKSMHTYVGCYRPTAVKRTEWRLSRGHRKSLKSQYEHNTSQAYKQPYYQYYNTCSIGSWRPNIRNALGPPPHEKTQKRAFHLQPSQRTHSTEWRIDHAMTETNPIRSRFPPRNTALRENIREE